ncbi:MAG: two-component system response regulator [Promethearchaeota archaeon Loki_b31]|nr:MAG: two-component system response regulator [Candidatus Lokiarchaeota archaeon Loki_b31]
MVRIFIVDDDCSTLKLYQKIPNICGFEIMAMARNGEDAVSKFRNFKIKPDLIIMDYHMPVKDGKEAAEEILELDKNAKLIICSGDSNVKEEVISMGALDFIDKPFSLKIFLNKINNICNNLIPSNEESNNILPFLSKKNALKLGILL